MSLQKELQARLLDLPDVELKHATFRRGKQEFARLLGENTLELRLTKAKIHVLKPDYRLEIGFPPRDWLLVHFDEEADVDYAMKLAEQAWKTHERTYRERGSERRGRGRVI
jgi:hypothetical protein